MPSELKERVCAAFASRAELHARDETDAYRLFHGWTEGLPGLEVDRYGDYALMVAKGADPSVFEVVADALEALQSFRGILAKVRGERPICLRGEDPGETCVVRELGLSYRVELHQVHNPGLYLDARPARVWLLENARDRRLLNLFFLCG